MIGLSSSWPSTSGLGIYDSVKKIHDMGFELVELGANHEFEEKVVETLKKIKRDFPNLKFTVHACFPPFKEYYLFNPCEGLTHNNKILLNRMFQTARIVNASVVSFHPGLLQVYGRDGYYKELPGFKKFKATSEISVEKGFNNAIDVFKYALKLSKKQPVLVAIENMAPQEALLLKDKSAFSKIFEIVPELNMLYDIGHDAKSGITHYEYFDFKDKIVQMHIHDFVDGWDHRALGAGSVDLKQISKNKDLLRKIPLVLEHASNVSEKEILDEKRLVSSLLD